MPVCRPSSAWHNALFAPSSTGTRTRWLTWPPPKKCSPTSCKLCDTWTPGFQTAATWFWQAWWMAAFSGIIYTTDIILWVNMRCCGVLLVITHSCFLLSLSNLWNIGIFQVSLSSGDLESMNLPVQLDSHPQHGIEHLEGRSLNIWSPNPLSPKQFSTQNVEVETSWALGEQLQSLTDGRLGKTRCGPGQD